MKNKMFAFSTTSLFLCAIISNAAIAQTLFESSKAGDRFTVKSNLLECTEEMNNAFVHTTEDSKGLRVAFNIPSFKCTEFKNEVNKTNGLEIVLNEIGKVEESLCTKPGKKFQNISATAIFMGKMFPFKSIAAEQGYTSNCSTP